MNESGREISELAELLPAPAGRDLPTARKQILKEHLMTELRQPGPADGQPAPKSQPAPESRPSAPKTRRPTRRRASRARSCATATSCTSAARSPIRTTA